MAATTFGWGSVMDYLAPHVVLREGHFDLSDAYPGDIGEYDRLAIRWGYTPHADPATLDRMVREAQARGVVYPHPSDARWNEYDWGADPVLWLPATMEVRREMLRRFGIGQLRNGEPVYDLQRHFSLAYLYHRYAIQAAQRAIGGRYVTNALAGDGQVPIADVPAAKQREALEHLIVALTPSALEVPANAASVLVPAPSTMEPTRERFASEAGDLFSPLTAARVLAGLIVHPLLDPERAARLTLAEGADALTLDRLLSRLIAATWGVGDGAERSDLRTLRHIGQRATLDAMLALAARTDAAPEVRGAVLARLEALRVDLARRNATDPATRAHLRLAARDLAEFLDRPETRAARPPAPPVPPGRPIAR